MLATCHFQHCQLLLCSAVLLLLCWLHFLNPKCQSAFRLSPSPCLKCLCHAPLCHLPYSLPHVCWPLWFSCCCCILCCAGNCTITLSLLLMLLLLLSYVFAMIKLYFQFIFLSTATTNEFLSLCKFQKIINENWQNDLSVATKRNIKLATEIAEP